MPRNSVESAEASAEANTDAQRLVRVAQLTRNASARPLSEVFFDCEDDLWFWAYTVGVDVSEELKSLLPQMPEREIQMITTGRQGKDTLEEGFKAYQLFKHIAEEHGVSIGTQSRLLDFGCGWGRLTRFFLKEVLPENLYAIDVNSDLIELCRNSNLNIRLFVNQPYPPTGFGNDLFDVIYAYSVFSHLAEKFHLAWVAEFQRILKPGGLLIATTRPREFISFCKEYHARHGLQDHVKGLAHAFPDEQEALASYDNGEFVFSPTGGGGVLEAHFFGEAAIPEAYVRKNWSEYFSVVDFVPVAVHGQFDQNVLVGRK